MLGKVDQSYVKVFGLSVIVWLIQIMPYLLGMVYAECGEFSLYLYKGALGISQDLISYGFQINQVFNDLSLFRVDPATVSNNNLVFPDGNLVALYGAFWLKITGSLTWTTILAPLPVLFISAVFVFKLVGLFFENKKIWWTALMLSLCFLTGFDDILGLRKLSNYLMGGELFIPGTNHLVMGYLRRFPHAQISSMVFFACLYFLISFLKGRRQKHFYLLVIFLAISQYIYFHYWTFLLAFTVLLLLPEIKRHYLLFVKGLGVWLVLILPYVYTAINFSLHPLSAAFKEKMSGFPDYSFFGVYALYLILSLFRNKRQLSFILIPLIVDLMILGAGYVFQPFHWVPTLLKGAVVLYCFFAIFQMQAGSDVKLSQRVNNVNFLLTFLLLKLDYLIGFNVEPYHWVYIATFPIFVIASIVEFKDSQLWSKRFIIPTMTAFIVFGAGLNGMNYARANYRFWTFDDSESEVLAYLKSKDETLLIGGNNFALNASLAVNSQHKLYSGISHLGDLSQEQSCQRLIHSYFLLGYGKEEVFDEYMQYKSYPQYLESYRFEKDSLGSEWPANISLVTEVILDYWHWPEYFEEDFQQYLDQQTMEIAYEPDVLLLYRRGDKKAVVSSSYQMVLNTKEIIVYSREE